MSLRGFEVAIDRFIKKDVPEEVGKLARVIATGGLNKVVQKSPVDKGRFEGGWMVTIDSRTDAAPPELAEGQRGPGTAAVLNAGLATIGTAQPFQSIVLQNNVEYGEALEDGSSPQAPGPGGILAISVAELESVFGS